MYGGRGMIGSRICSESVARGHAVSSITRTPAPDQVPGVVARTGDAADGDDVAMVAAQHDVVVSAIGPSRTGGRPERFLEAIQTLVENVGPRRLIVVGGAGSLQIAPGLRLMDTPEFPMSAKVEAQAQAAALDLLRDSQNLADWVYVSPAPGIAPGQRTGQYLLGADTVVGDFISAEDFAVAVVDEIDRPRYKRSRFAVAGAGRGR